MLPTKNRHQRHHLRLPPQDDDNIELWESGKFPPSQRRILVTHLLAKAWQKVCSKPTSLRRYFTKTGCGMTATGEDDDLISPQRFKAGDVKYPYLGMPIGLELYKT